MVLIWLSAQKNALSMDINAAALGQSQLSPAALIIWVNTATKLVLLKLRKTSKSNRISYLVRPAATGLGSPLRIH